MIEIVSTSILDLRMSTPEWVDAKARACSSRMTMFDPLTGYMEFVTQSSFSKNPWTQIILFDNWDTLVNLSETVTLPWGPLEPEKEAPEEIPWGPIKTTEEQPWGALEPNKVEKTDPWQEVIRKFPEVINGDVFLHCSCPAWIWWGSQFNLEQRNTELYPEGVPYPTIRDPQLSNIICKHMACVLNTFF